MNCQLETNTDPKFGDTCVLNEDGGLSNGGEYLLLNNWNRHFTVQFVQT